MVQVVWGTKSTNVPIADIRKYGVKGLLKAAIPDIMDIVKNEDHGGFLIVYCAENLSEEQIKELNDGDAVRIIEKLKSKFARPISQVLGTTAPVIGRNFATLPNLFLERDFERFMRLETLLQHADRSLSGAGYEADTEERSRNQRTPRPPPPPPLQYPTEVALLKGFGFGNTRINDKVLIKTRGNVNEAVSLLISAGN